MRVREIRKPMRSESQGRQAPIGPTGILALQVILQAKADLAYLASDDRRHRQDAEDAYSFVFSDRVEPWARAAHINVRVLRKTIMHAEGA